VPVPVMGIRNMRAAVPQPFAAMAVPVRTCGHDLVSLLVAAHAKAEASERDAYGRTWHGGPAPDIARLQAARLAPVGSSTDGVGAGLKPQM